MSKLRFVVGVVVLAAAWEILPSLVFRTKTAQYGGFVHPQFREVEDVFRKNLESGKELGASFAVYHNGQVLVDLWGGVADPETRRPWQHDTMSQAWSSTKGAAAIVMAMLVDRGLLDYDEYVKTYWPEFDQNGKSNITVSMLLSHQSGLVSLGRQFTLPEYRDNWSEIERQMAEQEPAWIPGTHCCYHAFTFGMYADALVRKVDPQHRNMSHFFREEIAQPFGIDFHIGLPKDQFFRSARARYVAMWRLLVSNYILNPSRWSRLPDVLLSDVPFRSINVFDFMNNLDIMNDAELQSIGLPSAVGFGTARSLAKMYDYLGNDGSVKGRELLSHERITSLSTQATNNTTTIGHPELPFSMGMVVEKNPLGGKIFGHRGYGGQNAFADPTYKLGVAYITNFNDVYSDSDDPREWDLLMALYKCLHRYKELN